MKTYTIDTENNITAHATAQEAEALAGTERFATEAELNQLAAKWPDARPTEIYNTLPGVTAGTTFKTRKAAVARIWKAIKGLGEPRAATSRKVPPRKPRVAPAKAKSSKKATPPKKAAKGAKKAKHAKPVAARQGSKTAKVLDLLKRPGGATLKELMKTTGWQPHSVRGFLSGTVGKKMGLTLNSTKGENGERSYKLAR
jgi:hypothetical protein